MHPRKLGLVTVLAVCAVVALGCGNSDDDDGGNSGGSGSSSGYGNNGAKKEKEKAGGASGGSQLKLTADPGGALKFDKTSLSTKPGEVTVVLDNPSDLPHAIEVEGKGVEEEGKTVGKGGVSKVTVDVKPGKYEYYCPVDGHKQAGMEGTLTVK
jgi:plastocyanin